MEARIAPPVNPQGPARPSRGPGGGAVTSKRQGGVMALESVDPATGETIAAYDEHTAEEVRAAAREAREAFAEWRRRPFAERAVTLRRAADLLEARATEHAALMAREMGKPVADGEAEARKCALACRHYADHGAAFLADEDVPTEAGRSFVAFEPLGVVLAVMPWNFPYWQVFRAAAPALMAGNAMLLKHAANVPRCALEIEAVFRAAGFPAELFRALLVGSDAVPSLIADARVCGVTLTGSEGAGSAVAEAAGRALKTTVLELGGSDPFIVLEDAD